MKVFIDFEATQFSNEIISIGATVNGNTFYSLVKPKKIRNVTTLITNMTGLTKDILQSESSIDVVMSNFVKWCNSLNPSSESIQFYCFETFDLDLLRIAASKHPNNKDIKFVKNKTIDISEFIIMLLMDDDYILRKRRNGNALSSMYEKISDKQLDKHNALSDAIMLEYCYNYAKTINLDNPIVNQLISFIKKTAKNKKISLEDESIKEMSLWQFWEKYKTDSNERHLISKLLLYHKHIYENKLTPIICTEKSKQIKIKDLYE